MKDTLITTREPPSRTLSLKLGEVWQYRELLGLLVWRNTVVRYKQSVIGIGWVVLKPVISMVVISLIFGSLAKLPSDGVPYPLLAYSALLPWTYFSSCLTGSGNSLVGGAGLITKVYFPRLVLPLSQLVTGLVDFAISFLVLIGLMLWYRESVDLSLAGVLCLPFFLLLAMLTALAFGLWLTSMMVKYRDIQQLLPFIVQIWMYMSPVVYSGSLVPDRFRLLYALNPMASVINGFRWALLGKEPPDPLGLAISTVLVLVVLVSGLWFFKRTERIFADII